MISKTTQKEIIRIFLENKCPIWFSFGKVPVSLENNRPKRNWQNLTLTDSLKVKSKLEIFPHDLSLIIPSNMIVIDIDVKNDGKGFESISKLELDSGVKMPLHIQTMNSGYHSYFLLNDSMRGLLSSSNAHFEEYPDIEFRTKGTQVVIPTGINKYNFLWNLDEIFPLREFPKEIYNLLSNRVNTTNEKEIYFLKYNKKNDTNKDFLNKTKYKKKESENGVVNGNEVGRIDFIKNEVLRYLNPDMEYPDWIEVGMGLHSMVGNGEDNLFWFTIWDQWSKGDYKGIKSKRYQSRSNLEKHWRSFVNGKGVNWAYVQNKHLRNIYSTKNGKEGVGKESHVRGGNYESVHFETVIDFDKILNYWKDNWVYVYTSEKKPYCQIYNMKFVSQTTFQVLVADKLKQSQKVLSKNRKSSSKKSDIIKLIHELNIIKRVPTAEYRPDINDLFFNNESNTDLVLNCYDFASDPKVPAEYDPLFFKEALPRLKQHLSFLSYGQSESEDITTLLMDIIAFIVQKPGGKIRFAPFFIGYQGSGKSEFFQRLFIYLLGRKNLKLLSEELIKEHFNEYQSSKKVLIVPEAFVTEAGYSKLKSLITDDTFDMRKMFEASEDANNLANYFFMANHGNALPSVEGMRRFLVIKTNIESKEEFTEILNDPNNKFLLNGDSTEKKLTNASYFRNLYNNILPKYSGSFLKYFKGENGVESKENGHVISELGKEYIGSEPLITEAQNDITSSKGGSRWVNNTHDTEKVKQIKEMIQEGIDDEESTTPYFGSMYLPATLFFKDYNKRYSKFQIKQSDQKKLLYKLEYVSSGHMVNIFGQSKVNIYVKKAAKSNTNKNEIERTIKDDYDGWDWDKESICFIKNKADDFDFDETEQ